MQQKVLPRDRFELAVINNFPPLSAKFILKFMSIFSTTRLLAHLEMGCKLVADGQPIGRIIYCQQHSPAYHKSMQLPVMNVKTARFGVSFRIIKHLRAFRIIMHLNCITPSVTLAIRVTGA